MQNKTSHKPTRILAVDPGYERVGIAILEKDGATRERVVFSECFRTSTKDPHARRLSLIAEEIHSVITTHAPEALAIEELFFNDNRTTAIKVAEARGVVLSEAARQGLAVYEYSPLQVKVAVTGYGRSDKSQVIMMVEKLVQMPKKRALDDEYDAIAIGLTHLACVRPVSYR